MWIKYTFSLLATCMAATALDHIEYLWVCGIEFALIVFVSEALLQKNGTLGIIVHYLLLLVYNAQIGLLYFSGSFLSAIMLENVGLLEDLSGNMKAYLLYVLVALICTFLPPKSLAKRKWKVKPALCALAALLAVEAFNIGVIGQEYSIAYSFVNLARENAVHNAWKNKSGESVSLDHFIRYEVADHYSKPKEMPETPNIILIFTEGLSSNIVFDERDVMPNVRSFLADSISFENYFNHTAATFMGLSGQIYSGYQLNNTDRNCLIGLHDILKDTGYHTTFINPEPGNKEFTDFLRDFGWDELAGDMSDCSINHATGGLEFIDDKKMFEMLLDICEEQSNAGQPFFASMYTFGTHVSFDSDYQKYGDGSNSVLNRFYNLDYCFGNFMEKFMNSDFAEDTIVVFTTDHATYPDNAFRKTFPGIERIGYVSEVPLGIYYKGITPSVFDVNGRNSLGLAPTILDFLDISAPNFFLGSTLFSDKEQGEFETIFQSLSTIFDTADGTVKELDIERYEYYLGAMSEYFTLKSQGENLDLVGINEEVLEDGLHVKLTLKNIPAEYNYVFLPIWSVINGQDDARGYKAEKNDEGDWEATFFLSDFNDIGEFIVHVYAGESEQDQDLKCLGGKTLTYDDIIGLKYEIQEDGINMKIDIYNVPLTCTSVFVPMWSGPNGQDDIIWLNARKIEEDRWEALVSLTDFADTGAYVMHLYVREDGDNSDLIWKGAKVVKYELPADTEIANSTESAV